MNENQIYDIYELDKISAFPPGPGIIILLLVFILSFAYYKYSNNKKEKRLSSWQHEAKTELDLLIESNEINIRALHELIKKIITRTTNRTDTAKLTGKQLLKFLQKNDPHKFNWLVNGEILENIFKKEKKAKNSNNIKGLIEAIKLWI